jgi:hypothetical protein
MSAIKEGALRYHLLICAAAIVAALSLVTTAVAKHWPDPPAWWMHSTQMVCVRYRESKDGRASPNIYEIQGPNATASDGDYDWLYGAPREEQDYLAWLIWKRSGCHQPWGRYDGCC